MTDNEIIKGLECCANHSASANFRLTYQGQPLKLLLDNALDLINRQKAEIEALIAGQETLQKYRDDEINRLEIELKAMRGAANSYKAEVERLEKNLKETFAEIEALKQINLHYKAEVVKEFAKFLVDKAEKGVISIVDLPDYTREWMVKADESGFNLNTAEMV